MLQFEGFPFLVWSPPLYPFRASLVDLVMSWPLLPGGYQLTQYLEGTETALCWEK